MTAVTVMHIEGRTYPYGTRIATFQAFDFITKAGFELSAAVLEKLEDTSWIDVFVRIKVSRGAERHSSTLNIPVRFIKDIWYADYDYGPSAFPTLKTAVDARLREEYGFKVSIDWRF